MGGSVGNSGSNEGQLGKKIEKEGRGKKKKRFKNESGN
jgi:hypothetical protein